MLWKRIYCDKIYELAHYCDGENIQEVDICLIDLAVETNGRVPNVTRKGIG